jgi:3-deoxy-D-arabino-heptulosonate 7-phosphate (DAHP) synthase
MTTELKILSLKAWFPFEGDKLIIAGPCSAETKNQTLQTASALKDIKKSPSLQSWSMETTNQTRFI